MIKSILIVLATLTLTACSNIPKIINPVVETVDKPTLELPEVDTFNARNVGWVIVTPENVNTIFADMQDSNQKIVLFAVTEEGYENLSLNIADIIKLVKQQKAIIAAYKQYYETTQ